MHIMKKFMNYYKPYRTVFLLDMICALVISVIAVSYTHLVFEILCKDKKASGDHVTVVKVNTIGKAELKEWKLSDVRHILKG